MEIPAISDRLDTYRVAVGDPDGDLMVTWR